MAPVHILDDYYLAITLIITVAYQFTGFFIAWTFQFDKITDFTGGSNFFILALVTLLTGQHFHARNIIASVLVMIWATRISGFLLYRVLKTGSDNRFDNIRSHFFKFLAFWIGQIVWVWVVSLPVTILNSPSVSNDITPAFGTKGDIIGIVVWALGWLIESVADGQKFHYKQINAVPKDRPMAKGIWGWSRHPPYFGEMLCWWGIWVLSQSPSTHGHLPMSVKNAQLGAIVSPLFTFVLLLFGSGLPTSEKPTGKKFYLMSHGPNATSDDAWLAYQEHARTTSMLVPLPKMVYSMLPVFLKKTILFDWPMYRFKEDKDGPAALKEASERSERVA